MGTRQIKFINNHFYHVFNKGVDKRPIYLWPDDFDRFIQSIDEFNSIEPIGSIFWNSFRKDKSEELMLKKEKLISIICYCLNPNHYHLILEQIADDGIKKFMHRLGTGYTKYFNFKHQRSGSLFGNKFKAVLIDSNEYLLHVSAYVNLNYQVHQLRSKASKSSWDEYQNNQGNLCSKKIILQQFKGAVDYANFAQESLIGIRERKNLAKFLLE